MRMKLIFYNIFLLIICSCLLTSCWGLFYEQHIIDSYYLIAVDGTEDLCIACSTDNGKSYYSYVIPSTVYAVGYNDDFIIAKQHPCVFSFPPDTSIANYFIIPLKNKIGDNYSHNIIGSLTLEEFVQKRKELSIPEDLLFSIEMDKETNMNISPARLRRILAKQAK